MYKSLNKRSNKFYFISDRSSEAAQDHCFSNKITKKIKKYFQEIGKEKMRKYLSESKTAFCRNKIVKNLK